MSQGCLLKEAVVSRTFALIAENRGNLSRGLQESKALSLRHLKAPLKDLVLFSLFQGVFMWIWKVTYFGGELCVSSCCGTQAKVPGIGAQLHLE